MTNISGFLSRFLINKITLIAALIILSLPLLCGRAGASEIGSRSVAGEIIVKIRSRDDLSNKKIETLSAGKVKESLIDRSYKVVKVVPGSEEAAIAKLSSDPAIEFAEPNFKVRATDTAIELNGYRPFDSVQAAAFPDDPNFVYQWNFPQINVPGAWSITSGGNTVVAVADTGVAYEDYAGTFFKLPDFASTTFVPGYNFVDNTTHANDDNGHGTHVAATIAESTNNGLSEAGIAFSASIMPVKVLDSFGNGAVSDLVNGIIFAADNGADVLNLSLSTPSPSAALQNAVDYARYNKSVVVVAAAGNNGSSSIDYPARYDSVIAVGAVRYDQTRAYYSQYGTGIDLMAPGGDLNVDQNGDGVPDGILQQTIKTRTPSIFGDFLYQGTSMAAPHVSAVAALAVSRGVTDAGDVYNLLTSRAKDLGPPGYDPEYGYGLVDAVASVNLFSSLQLWNSGPNNWSISSSRFVTGDYNNDGLSDIACLYGYADSRSRLIVFLSNGSGYGLPAVWWDSGPGNWDWNQSKIVSGDFNGPGADDIGIVYNYGGAHTKGWVFTSTGTSFNQSALWWDSGPGKWDWAGSNPVAGDFNNDGVDDILILYGYAARQTKAWVLTSSGSAFNQPQQWWDSGPGNWDWNQSKIVSGDFNGPGADDIGIVYNYGGAHTKGWVFTSTGTSFNQSALWWDSGPGKWDWAAGMEMTGDLDFDGRDDLLIVYGYGGALTRLWGFASNGSTFDPAKLYWDSGPGNWSLNESAFMSGDNNGDFFSDIQSFYDYGGAQTGLWIIS